MIPPKPRLVLATPFCLLILAGSACAQGLAGPIERAQAQFRQELLLETAGVFWIVAEVAILFCMTTARRIFATRPVPPRVSLTPEERRRALRWGAGSIVLIIAVFGRHLFLSPLPEALQGVLAEGANLRERTQLLYMSRVHLHVALWCTFITGWVALEIAIVAQGVRAYRALRRLTADA